MRWFSRHHPADSLSDEPGIECRIEMSGQQEGR